MIRYLFLLLLLTGCNQALQFPGAVSCRGRMTIFATGSLSMIGGGGGNAVIDCGDGAYIEQGPPTPQPVAPSATGSYYQGTDGRRYWTPRPPAPEAPVRPPAPSGPIMRSSPPRSAVLLGAKCWTATAWADATPQTCP